MRGKKHPILIVLLGIIALPVLGFILLLVYLSLTEFRPDPLTMTTMLTEDEVSQGQIYRILSYNIGYGGLGEESDFFMDGGKEVHPRSRELVEKNLEGIKRLLKEVKPDFALLQEVDVHSRRSYFINQREYLSDSYRKHDFFAANYQVKYVPYPWPPIGEVHSGLVTQCIYDPDQSERVSLTVPFSWPVRLANLKRCLLVTEFPVEGTDKHLLLVNLHLEAYDGSGGRETQTKELLALMQEAYDKGDYVIAGGDWNQSFYEFNSLPFTYSPELWNPGVLDRSLFPVDWEIVSDAAVATSRLNNQPYVAGSDGTFLYVIDGFAVTPNVEALKYQVIDDGFMHSDHQPCLLQCKLLKEEK